MLDGEREGRWRTLQEARTWFQIPEAPTESCVISSDLKSRIHSDFGKGIHEKTPCDVTACRREYLRTAPRSEERLDRLRSPWSGNAFGVLPAVRAGELNAIESAVIVY
ncbi:hypothetical protein AVEN_224922-1 [Araneus ventricosus]|uniref:Uncharacterized protein n=1 Tax=Araneus ventricosus TaxID=182803 RepID=A0A4Y2UQM0_ARAVE|nr:hypothetical protein AVEN_224922-1 [Araneus ventricosus]